VGHEELITDIKPFTGGKPVGDGFAIWKTKDTGWDGEMQWQIPVKTFFDALLDGSHTFEITFEDKISQITSKSIVFYKDAGGPAISLINPGEMVYLDNDELAAINAGNISSIPGLKDKYDELAGAAIRDAEAKLIGNFSGAYSAMFETDDNKFW
jgi:hypothetical protein